VNVYWQTIPESWSGSCEGAITETCVRADNGTLKLSDSDTIILEMPVHARWLKSFRTQK